MIALSIYGPYNFFLFGQVLTSSMIDGGLLTSRYYWMVLVCILKGKVSNIYRLLAISLHLSKVIPELFCYRRIVPVKTNVDNNQNRIFTSSNSKLVLISSDKGSKVLNQFFNQSNNYYCCCKFKDDIEYKNTFLIFEIYVHNTTIVVLKLKQNSRNMAVCFVFFDSLAIR